MFHRIFCLVISVGLLAATTAPAFADDSVLQDAGVASAPDAANSPSSAPAAETPAAETPADKLHDPLKDPKAAIDDVKQAKRQGWPMLAFALGAIAAKLLGRSKKWPKLAFLNKGRTAVIVGMFCAVTTAGYNALAAGGSMYAMGYAVAIAVAAYWNSQPNDSNEAPN